MLRMQVELTDTFGGEANYAWVRRATIELPEGASTRTIMRRARAAVGYEGVEGRWEDSGDMLMFRPYRICHVLFVTLEVA